MPIETNSFDLQVYFRGSHSLRIQLVVIKLSGHESQRFDTSTRVDL